MSKKITIYDRGNVFWLRYTVNGKMVRESTGCRTLAEAKKFRAQRMVMLNDPTLHKHLPTLYKDVKFEVLAEDFAKHCESSKSWNSKKYLVANLNEHFAGMYVTKITKTELERYVKKHLEANHKESTINRHLAALSNMLSYGKDEGMVTEETQKVLRNFKRFDEKKFWRKKYLKPEQCAALLHAAREVDEHLYCAVIIAIYTGLRQCDILSLRWSNIGLDTREASLVMRKTSEPLVLPIPQTLHRYLSEQCTDKSASDYLITWRGKPIKSVRKSFAHACRIAGIEGLRFHDLRHTFASFIARKETLHLVAKLLGHTSLRCTVRYAHICNEQMVGAAADLDKLITI